MNKLECLRMSPGESVMHRQGTAIVKSTLTVEQKMSKCQKFQCILHMQKGKGFLISEKVKKTQGDGKKEKETKIRHD